MHHYTIQIQHKGGLFRLGTVVDPAEKANLLQRVNHIEGLSLTFSSDTGSINYLDHQDILACCGPYYANAQISIFADNALQAIESYVIPDDPDRLLSSLETETPYLDLDSLEMKSPQGLVFGGYTSYNSIEHRFRIQTEHPFDRNALFFGVVNLAELFGDSLVATHAYYLDKKHRIRLGRLAFPGEHLSDAFIYEELENIYEKGKNGQEEILQVLESYRINPIDTKMGQPISEHPYLYRVDGTPLYPKP